MPQLTLVRRVFVAAALLVTAGIAGAPGMALAQDASGTPAAGAMSEAAHPAHIHSGTCETLGDVVFPLNDVSHEDMMNMGTPMAGSDAEQATDDSSDDADDSEMTDSTPMAGAEEEQMADHGEVEAMSSTTVEASLDDILAAEHAINVHESAEKIDVYIACGEITGAADNGQLQVELKEMNDSGYTGRATLMDNGDGTTTVDVMLMEEDYETEGGMEATPSS